MDVKHYRMNQNCTLEACNPWKLAAYRFQSSTHTFGKTELDEHTFTVVSDAHRKYLVVTDLKGQANTMLQSGQPIGVFHALSAMPFFYKANNRLIQECQWIIDGIDQGTLSQAEASRMVIDIQSRSLMLQRLALEGAERISAEHRADEVMKGTKK